VWLRDAAAAEALAAHRSDAAVVAYGLILPKPILDALPSVLPLGLI
jgi:methionyl-tRNA formyltransferase